MPLDYNDGQHISALLSFCEPHYPASDKRQKQYVDVLKRARQNKFTIDDCLYISERFRLFGIEVMQTIGGQHSAMMAQDMFEAALALESHGRSWMTGEVPSPY